LREFTQLLEERMSEVTREKGCMGVEDGRLAA